MKKVLIILASVISIIFIIATVRATNNKSPETTSSVIEVKNTQNKEPLYIIKTHKNQIGIFRYNEPQPYLTLDEVMLKSLPEYDQKLLESGIKIYSEEALLKIIEDYDG